MVSMREGEKEPKVTASLLRLDEVAKSELLTLSKFFDVSMSEVARQMIHAMYKTTMLLCKTPTHPSAMSTDEINAELDRMDEEYELTRAWDVARWRELRNEWENRWREERRLLETVAGHDVSKNMNEAA